jgi:hypothetical protein
MIDKTNDWKKRNGNRKASIAITNVFQYNELLISIFVQGNKQKSHLLEKSAIHFRDFLSLIDDKEKLHFH